MRLLPLVGLALPVLAEPAFAQEPAALQPVQGPVRNAGIYHVATGTWTRHSAAQAVLAPDTIYKNQVASGYFTTSNAAEWAIDEGVIPSSGNVYAATGTPGVAVDEYFVNCFSFGYCVNSSVGNDVAWEFEFYDYYVPCTDVHLGNSAGNVLAGSFSSPLLPSSQTGNQHCWVVTFDLTGSEFCMRGDGDGVFDDDTNDDSFGWAFKWAGQSSASAFGPILNYDPDWTTGLVGVPAPYTGTGGGTYYHLPGDTSCNDQHTGLGTQDLWYTENTAFPTLCVAFGAYQNNNGCGGPSNTPGGSFSFAMFADVQASCAVSVGQSFQCPNTASNSTGNPGALAATGSDVAADNNLTLTATQLPNDVFGYFLNSMIQNPNGSTPPGSQGNLCIGPAGIGPYNRPGEVYNTGNTGSGALALDLTLTPIPQTPFVTSIQAGETWYFTSWYRDDNPGSTSNFTDAICIQFQ